MWTADDFRPSVAPNKGAWLRLRFAALEGGFVVVHLGFTNYFGCSMRILIIAHDEKKVRWLIGEKITRLVGTSRSIKVIVGV